MKKKQISLIKKIISVVALIAISTILVFIQFESPVYATMIPRYNARQSMTNMKNVYWIADYPAPPFTYDPCPNSGFVYSNSFSYYGIPYSQARDTSLTEFCTHIGSNSKMGSKDVGIDCSTAVVFALNDAGCAIGSPTSWNTETIITSDISNNMSFRHVGSYTTINCNNGSDIINNNSNKTMYQAYSNCKVGDILVHNDSAGKHAIMVTGKAINYDSSGTPLESSTISYIDQGQGNLGTSQSSWSTGAYSLSTLLSKKYVPITTSYFLVSDLA